MKLLAQENMPFIDSYSHVARKQNRKFIIVMFIVHEKEKKRSKEEIALNNFTPNGNTTN